MSAGSIHVLDSEDIHSFRDEVWHVIPNPEADKRGAQTRQNGKLSRIGRDVFRPDQLHGASANAPIRPELDPRADRDERFDLGSVIRDDNCSIDFSKQKRPTGVSLLCSYARECV